ncbi:hypothetical protein PO883_23375 [Massilia sp. DJPM01]|uniref:hypothetical protein n=1 Tax=Massilia sp. DJPM01 TaxID=3024404 RepID=UPI00259D6389|nr:hypothetical protein [Massilia sp. DJPM01]MDM5180129.1 hypothetical protein [Massilia sp. DJPM01]
MITLLVSLIIGTYVVVSLWATSVVIRDPYSERGQKVAQLVLAWFVPAIGALIVLAMHRKPEKPSRQYRNGADAGDDFAESGRGLRTTLDTLGDD